VLQVGVHAVAPKAKVVEVQEPLAEFAGYVAVAILHVCAVEFGPV